jgi:hypothetical protein
MVLQIYGFLLMPVCFSFNRDTPSAACVKQDIHNVYIKNFGQYKLFEKMIRITQTIHISIAQCYVHANTHRQEYN